MTSIERTPSGAASKSHNRRVAVVSGALVLGLLGSGGLVLRGTEAAFNASVSNGDNTWAAGTVDLQTDLAATLMFDSSGADGKMVPGKVLTKCIEVRYTGDTPLAVKLYAGVAGADTGLGTDLQLKVEEGDATSVATGGACTSFTAQSTLYNNVVLNTFKSTNNSYAAGAGNWTTPASNQNKVYRFTITMPLGTPGTASGKTAKAAFTWEGKPA